MEQKLNVYIINKKGKPADSDDDDDEEEEEDGDNGRGGKNNRPANHRGND